MWRDDAVITIATYLERHVRWMAQTPDLTNHSAFVSPGWGFLARSLYFRPSLHGLGGALPRAWAFRGRHAISATA